MVARLLTELPVEVPEILVERARVLDGYYIPTRYANGHPEGAPFEHYGRLHSRDAIEHADQIVERRFTASRDRGTDGDIGGAGQPGQQDRERGLHHHEQRRVVRTRKAILAAYPFGERRQWPYKVFCEEVKKTMAGIRLQKTRLRPSPVQIGLL